MSIEFECAECRRSYRVTDDMGGKHVKCKQCGAVIQIPQPEIAFIPAAELVEVADAAAPAASHSMPLTESSPEPEAAAPEPEPRGAGNPFVADWSRRVLAELSKVFIGQEELVRGVLIALLAEGHVLIESVPGLGKTLLVRTLGRVLGCAFNRIQFTPDLMPSDVTGAPVFDERIQDFRFRPGPVFTQLLLADEINRAPAKTHSALLEIMQETRVTVDGVAHPIDRPFLVMATQNPIESEGTYNLPEAQLDRFLFKLVADYPNPNEEMNILRLHTKGLGPDALLNDEVRTVTGPNEVLDVQRHCANILVDDRVLGYIASVVRKTREWPAFALGASPRAGVAILRGARAAAALEGRDFAVPDDVQDVALPSLRHRVILTPEAEVEGRRVDDLLADLMKTVEVPRR
jgi:MoxR-like ATPase